MNSYLIFIIYLSYYPGYCILYARHKSMNTYHITLIHMTGTSVDIFQYHAANSLY